MIDNNQYVWIHHGTNDRSPNALNAVRNFHNSLFNLDANRSRLTAYIGVGHSAWNQVYNDSGRGRSQRTGTEDGTTYYEWASGDSSWYDWMLAHAKVNSTAPTMITLNGSSIDENNSIGEVIGILSSNGTDPITYSLISGTGDDDNNVFSIENGNELRINTITDYETKNRLSIRVEATNNAGGYSKSITINVNDLEEVNPDPQDCGCDHTFTGLSANSVNNIHASDYDYSPGDVFCIEAGTIAGLRFLGFKGNSSNPLIFKNCGGQVIIEEDVYSGVTFRSSQYIHFTGTGDSEHEYGFKVARTGTRGAVGFSVSYLSSDFEIDHFDISNTGFAGIMAKTDPNCNDPLTWRRNGYVLRNLNIHHNYIHDVEAEGLYLGFTGGYKVSSNRSCNDEYIFGHWLENVEVHHNIVENAGWDGIQLNLVRYGGSVHHNKVTNWGIIADRPVQRFAMSIGGGRYQIYNNEMINEREDVGTGLQWISVEAGSSFYNNLLYGALGHGLFIHMRTEFEEPELGYFIGNNTIVNTEKSAFIYNAKIVEHEDPNMVGVEQNSIPIIQVNNLIVSPGSFYENSNFWKKYSENFFDFNTKTTRDAQIGNQYNNITTYNLNALGIIDKNALNFRPMGMRSVLVDAGTDVSSYSVTFDLDDNARPANGIYDIGAYEFSNRTLQAPTTYSLSNTSIDENNEINALVGLFSSDGDAPVTYALVSGTGSDDNSLFSIENGNELRINTVTDYETKNRYSIRAEATNSAGGYSKSVTINVKDLEEADPVDPEPQDCGCDHTLSNLSKTALNILYAADYSYAPGDVFCIEADTIRGLRLIDFEGAANNPLVFKNCDQQVIIDEHGYEGIEFRNSKYIHFTGTGSADEYGFKVIHTGASRVGFNIGFLCSDFEVDHLQIGHTGFAGIMAKTDPNCSDDRTWRRNGYILSNLNLHHNYIHDTEGEGFYLGFTGGYKVNSSRNCEGDPIFGHWLENIDVHHNIVENAGWDGIQLHLVRHNGTVHHNEIKNWGQANRYAQDFAMNIRAGSYQVYNNQMISEPGGEGNGMQWIDVEGGSTFYNNLLYGAKGYGMFMHMRTAYEDPTLGYFIGNNTFVKTERSAFFYNSAITQDPDPSMVGVRQNKAPIIQVNNLIVSPGSRYEDTNSWKDFSENFFDFNASDTRDAQIGNQYNNITTYDINSVEVVDDSAYNFRSSSDLSSLIDAGADVSSYGVNFDLDDNARPANGIYDIGAYEWQQLICQTDLELNSQNLTSGEYQSSNWIETAAQILPNANVNMHAIDYIELKPGFHAQPGSAFRAYILGCNQDNSNEEDKVEKRSLSFDRWAELKIWPNPSEFEINLKVSSLMGESTDYSIYSLQGEQIKTGVLGQGHGEIIQIDVSMIPTGAYILQLRSENQVPLATRFTIIK
ncbi:MAG: 3-coathanger stack domain-containing protein [Bacteroidota bacterium]